MKSRTVIILWIIAAVLGITAYIIKFHPDNEQGTHTRHAPGQKLIPDLPIRELTAVTLTQGENTTHLVRSAKDIWQVKERGNYPANHDLLRHLLGTLSEVEVTQGYPCSSKHHGRFGLAEKSTEKGEQGLRVTMAGKDGSPAAEVFLGKFSGTSHAGGRFLRLVGDDSGVYAVGETFPGITANPKDWLSKDFLKIDSIRSIAVSAPNDPGFKPWKLVRHPKTDGSPDPNGQLTLAEMTDTERINLTATNPLRNLFSYSAFQDVLTAEQAAKTANPDAKLKRRAVITTYDGLTYTLDFWPQKQKPKTPDTNPRLPAPQPGYLLTIKVSGQTPPKPQAIAEEKPETTKARETAFAQQVKTLQSKLQAASIFKGRIYQVSQNTISPLQKKRSDFVKPKTTTTTSPPVLVPPAPRP